MKRKSASFLRRDWRALAILWIAFLLDLPALMFSRAPPNSLHPWSSFPRTWTPSLLILRLPKAAEESTDEVRVMRRASSRLKCLLPSD